MLEDRLESKRASQWLLVSALRGRLWLRLSAATYVGLGGAAGSCLALTSSAAVVTQILHGNRWLALATSCPFSTATLSKRSHMEGVEAGGAAAVTRSFCRDPLRVEAEEVKNDGKIQFPLVEFQFQSSF